MASKHFKEREEVHAKLSDLTDHEPCIYEMCRDIARVAKQIKFDTREDTMAPKPVLEAINMMYESRIGSQQPSQAEAS